MSEPIVLSESEAAVLALVSALLVTLVLNALWDWVVEP